MGGKRKRTNEVLKRKADVVRIPVKGKLRIPEKPGDAPYAPLKPVKVEPPAPINADLTAGEKLTEAGRRVTNEVVVPTIVKVVKEAAMGFLRKMFRR